MEMSGGIILFGFDMARGRKLLRDFELRSDLIKAVLCKDILAMVHKRKLT